MKIKVVANYDSDINIYNSVLNCFGIDESIQLTLDDEEANFLFVINGYDTSKIKHPRNKIFGLLQEPKGNINYDRNLPFYCSKIFCQSKDMFKSYKGIIETPVCMFYSHHTSISKEQFLSYKNFDNRKKLCIIMSSIRNPNNTNWLDHNYEKRYKLINLLLNSDLDFDFYGRGWNLSDSRYKGEATNKHEILKKYEYSIAIENVCEKNYASEKLFDCFLNNTVPLYYGCPNVDELYKSGSYELIDIESENVVEDIRKILENSNESYRDNLLLSKNKYFDKYNIYNLARIVL